MPLSKAEFAALVRRLPPDATEEEILFAAREEEKRKLPSTVPVEPAAPPTPGLIDRILSALPAPSLGDVEKLAAPLKLTPLFSREDGKLSGSALRQHVNAILDLHNQAKGATYNLHSGNLSGRKAFAVSVEPGREKVFPPGHRLTPKDLAAFVRQHTEVLMDPRASLGTWEVAPEDASDRYPAGSVVVGISMTPTDEEKAHELGAKHGEEQIFDLKNLRTIPVREEKKRKLPSPIGAVPKDPEMGVVQRALGGLARGASEAVEGVMPTIDALLRGVSAPSSALAGALGAKPGRELEGLAAGARDALAGQPRAVSQVLREKGAMQPLGAEVEIGGKVSGEQVRDALTDILSDPLNALDLPLKGAALAAAPLAATRRAAKGIRAFHGSPYDFDKFDIAYVGTGEGANTYGKGLYFAENPEVAANYRRRLSKGHVPPPEILERYFTPGQIVEGYGGMDRVLEFHPATDKSWWSVVVQRVDAAGNPIEPPRIHSTAPSVDKINQVFASRGEPEFNPGRTYEVEIDADPEALLNWDAPLKEQTERVKQALQELGILDEPNVPIAGNIAKEVARRGNEAVQAGIPGIRYLDRGSRDAKSGTSNYVIFDDRIINILRKWGLLPPALAAGAERVNEDR